MVKRNYEFAFLIKEGDIAKAVIERIKALIGKNKCEVLTEDNMGNRQLAYTITKNREKFNRAHYYFLRAECQTSSLHDIEKHLKIDEDIIRYMVLVEQ